MTASRTHTPGPWQVGTSAAGKGGTPHHIWRADEHSSTNYVRIAQHVHSEANARLIAAAPDMLSALKQIASDEIVRRYAALEQLNMALSAIAKAEAMGDRTAETETGA